MASTAFEWLLNFSVTHHVTMDLANLTTHTPYSGLEDIFISNVVGLSITHIGSLSSSFTSYPFKFHNILYVPS